MCLANPYLVMGDFTVGTVFTQPLAGNGHLQYVFLPPPECKSEALMLGAVCL
jgi:hypothetical protein